MLDINLSQKKSHLKAVKRIFRYLKGTINLGLWYSKGTCYELIAYTDADHGGCKHNRKSTSEHVQFLGDELVSWALKKQNAYQCQLLKQNMWLPQAAVRKLFGLAPS